MGLNDRGQIVGSFQSGGLTHGFLLADGELTQIDVPDATATFASGINNLGRIVGVYLTTGGTAVYGRHLDGSFSLIDIPGAGTILRVSINDSGDIAGSFIDTTGATHGFVSGSLTTCREQPDCGSAGIWLTSGDGDCDLPFLKLIARRS
jgi:uncharacterized membrane protein